MPTFTRASESMLSPADLLAFAAKQSSSEASRYAHAAEVARARGNHELAQLLGILAERQPAAGELNDREAERVRRLLPPALAEADAAMEEAIGSALLTPYRALALAVQEAQRNFRTFGRSGGRPPRRRGSCAQRTGARRYFAGGASSGLSRRTAERHASTCHVARAACIERNMGTGGRRTRRGKAAGASVREIPCGGRACAGRGSAGRSAGQGSRNITSDAPHHPC